MQDDRPYCIYLRKSREDREIERHWKRTEAEKGIHLKKYNFDEDDNWFYKILKI